MLIVSIFAPSRHNRRWYEVQSDFVRRTTAGNYDYALYLNGVNDDAFPNSTIGWRTTRNQGHSHSLTEILRTFRSQRDYDRFLVLDSDCFPICKDWNAILDRQMARFSKTIAAPVRTENLDLFPHPCAFYLTAAGVQNPGIRMDMGQANNMLDQTVNDVCAQMTSSFEFLLPLLRTNRLNLHPVAAAIYHHLFYHHGAGSRAFKFRVTSKYSFYDHFLDSNQACGEALMREFSADPEAFLYRLTGKRLWEDTQL